MDGAARRVTAAEFDVGRVFAALAVPRWLGLLAELSGEGKASATTLAARMPVSRQAIVKHLHVLEAADLVTGGRSGREVLFRVRPEPLEASSRWLAELGAEWDRRLSRLKHVAEALERTASGAGVKRDG